MVQTGVFGVTLSIQGWLSRHSEFPSLQRGYPTSINLISNCLKGVAPAPSLFHIVVLSFLLSETCQCDKYTKPRFSALSHPPVSTKSAPKVELFLNESL